ncbi:hypothetical protein L3Y34_002721 [Caenorhabditis briggsae]|uniref:Uncharacterized protein n=2 Tax=Caenorhabditis briggsae TaxID=6238 RepID=A0AAE9DGG5_CAEBR|nr:hypothetical protein L3Y34_002721 [Caenorhabditis briggsae]
MSQMIPVIGVPPAANAQKNPVQNQQKPPKRASKIKAAASIPKKVVKQQKEKSDPVLDNIITLKTSTGMPKSDNGTFAKREGEKLTAYEKKALELWLNSNKLLDPNATDRQKKKHLFRHRLIWLLNKPFMMRNTKNGEFSSILIQKMKEAVEKIEKKSTENAVKNEEKSVEPKIAKLMDKSYESDNDDKDYQRIQEMGNSYGDSVTPMEYQFLKDDWIESQKPWKKLEVKASPDMLSPAMMSQWQAPPTSQMMPLQYQAMGSAYGTSQSPFPYPTNSTFFAPPAAPQPTFSTPSAPSMAPTVPVTPPSTDFYGAPEPGYVSQYRQAFPATSPPVDMTQNFSIPQQPSYDQFSTSSARLEASEEELIRQKRLLEIEEELCRINAKKVQMQMEEEIRMREYELAMKQKSMIEKERQLRDYEDRRSVERDYESSSSRNRRSSSPPSRHYSSSSSSRHRDDYYDSYHRRSSDRQRDTYLTSSSSANPRGSYEIGIPDNGGRRLGGQLQQRQQQKRNEMMGMLPRGEEDHYGSLKRSADGGSHRESHNGNRSTMNHSPAKRQRTRTRKRSDRGEVQMEAISDEE